jgi:toxin-antitoxin system PIN domain toxin
LIAVDTNILIYAHRAESPFHPAASLSLRTLGEGSEPWAIPWPCVHEFLAIVTNGRACDPPTPLDMALDVIQSWLESPSVVVLSESGRYWEVLRDIIWKGRALGGRVHDARIAALCLEHGVRELWSADRDFARVPDLATVNPLVARG